MSRGRVFTESEGPQQPSLNFYRFNIRAEIAKLLPFYAKMPPFLPFYDVDPPFSPRARTRASTTHANPMLHACHHGEPGTASTGERHQTYSILVAED